MFKILSELCCLIQLSFTTRHIPNIFLNQTISVKNQSNRFNCTGWMAGGSCSLWNFRPSVFAEFQKKKLETLVEYYQRYFLNPLLVFFRNILLIDRQTFCSRCSNTLPTALVQNLFLNHPNKKSITDYIQIIGLSAVFQ